MMTRCQQGQGELYLANKCPGTGTAFPRMDQFGGDELSMETYIVGSYKVSFDFRHLLWLFSRNFGRRTRRA
jgi:hypothetical protein